MTVLQEVAPRSFTVKTEEGQIFSRCNLLKTSEPVREHGEAITDSEPIPLLPAD